MNERSDIKSYCENCDFETNHTVLKCETINGEDYDCKILYMIVRCKGCDRTSFRREFLDFENAYPDRFDNWHPEVTVETHPRKRIEQEIEYLDLIPEKIKIVYLESIDAYNSECYLLAGVGFRAVIEAICLDKNINGRDLAKKIDNLSRQQLITLREAQRLHSIRFIGNDSVHEMSVPEKNKLLIVLGIIVHLLKNLYIIDHQMIGNLETIIDHYSEFENLLDENLKNCIQGHEIPLAKIFGKSIRRVHDKIQDFEKQLISKITEGEYSKLKVGKVATFGNKSNPVQHFVIE